MEQFKKYQNSKKVDELVWSWLPRSIGFWSWIIASITFLNLTKIDLDLVLIISLGISITIYFLFNSILKIFGKRIIYTYLWEQYGCGCVAKIISTELIQYFVIIIFCFIQFYKNGYSFSEAIFCSIIGVSNWILITYILN
jgi:hypothetical protein